jgi:hypothetical protein
LFFATQFVAAGPFGTAVILRESGVSSMLWLLGSFTNALEYWITRFRG